MVLEKWSKEDTIATVLFFIVALFSRGYHVNYPPLPVWDEFHVGRFVNLYFKNEFFFDLHPPLWKMIYFHLAEFLGYKGDSDCNYHLSDPLCPSIWKLRVIPVLLGSLLVPLTFIGCRFALQFSRTTSLLAAVILIVDNFFLSFSRVHLNDIPTLFVIAVSIHLSFASTREIFPFTFPWSTLLWQGFFMGLSLSSKYGIAIPLFGWVAAQNLGLIFKQFSFLFPKKPTDPHIPLFPYLSSVFLRVVIFLGIPVALSFFLMKLHFNLAYKDGGGASYFSKEIGATLEGNPNQKTVPFDKIPTFFEKVYAHLEFMVEYSRLMAVWFPPGSSSNDSLPKEWFVMGKGILHTFDPQGSSTSGKAEKVLTNRMVMYQNGNPVIWLSISAIVIFSFFLYLSSFVYSFLRKSNFPFEKGVWLLLGWILYFVPFCFLERQMFVTYYLPAYYFGFLNLFYLLDFVFVNYCSSFAISLISAIVILVSGTFHFYLLSLLSLEKISSEVIFKLQLSNGDQIWNLVSSYFI